MLRGAGSGRGGRGAGARVCLAAPLVPLIPFAAGHELIRQGRRDLTLMGPISDMLFDQLVGAGCVRRIVAAWVGNVSAGLGHDFRCAVEQCIPQPLAVGDHSNLTIAVGLQAGGAGGPALPTPPPPPPPAPRPPPPPP